MDFIATYWWVWLAGVLIVLGVVFIRWVSGFVGLAKDTAAIASKLHVAFQAPSDDRREHLTRLGIDVACDRIKKRAIDYFVTAGLVLFGGVFGILLLLAIIRYGFLYFRSSA